MLVALYIVLVALYIVLVSVSELILQYATFVLTACTGVTASGLFSQSAVTAGDKPHHRSRASRSSMAESTCDNIIRSSSPLSNTSHADTSDRHQERVKIVEDHNQMITYSGDSQSYSGSQAMTLKSQGTLHAFTIALALSVHSIFEGLAFGLQDTMNQVCMHVYKNIHM